MSVPFSPKGRPSIKHRYGDATAADGARPAAVAGDARQGFFTGSLIARFGVLRIMLIDVGLFVGHVPMILTGTGFNSFVGALVLLGVGWNFLYIGGTTLLSICIS